jgi:MFS transporter, AAHS family, 4-hydroxybenzoate transporter
MNPQAGGQVDVGAALDHAQFRGLPLLVMLCAAAIMVLDGFDIQVIGFAAPALAAQFGVERSALAPALAASLIGMALGGFTLGPWGDRHGRRPALLLSAAVFGVFTLLTAVSTSIEHLVILRFATGLGLGGALPNATALMAEFAPPRARAQAIAAAIVGVPVGGMLGAAIAAEIIPAFGWQAIFIVGGALPLLAVAVLYFLLPESPRYLAAHASRGAELAAILNRVVGAARYTGNERFTLSTAAQTALPHESGSVFSRWRLHDTLALWVVFATNLFAVYCFYNWAPVVLTSMGMDLATAVRGSLVFNTAGLVGSLFVSFLTSRLGSRWPQTVCGVCGAAALFGVGQLVMATEQGSVTLPTATIMAGFAVAGFCILAVQVTMYAVAAHVYPTNCRSAGVGWAQGLGRIGGVLSAFVGAFMMNRVGASGFFFAVTAVLAITVAGTLLLRRHIPAAERSQPARSLATREQQ